MVACRIVSCSLLAVLLLGPSAAVAQDQRLDAVKLILRRNPHGSVRLMLLSTDALNVPASGSPDDPRTAGATVDVFVYGRAPATFAAPSGEGRPGWRPLRGAGGFAFENRTAPAGISRIRGLKVKQGGPLRLLVRDADIDLDGSLVSVGVRVNLGGTSRCVLFGPSTLVRDDPGVFVARGALASSVADCSDMTLSGAGTCGDNVVNQPSEECDGASCSAELACGAPGSASECSCCTNSGGCLFEPCCHPLDACAILNVGHSLPVNMCVRAHCGVTSDCNPPSVCDAEGNCCVPAGEEVQPIPFGIGVPCCDGLTAIPSGGITARCCAPIGGSCADDGDCCAGTCTAEMCS